jgi:hypothetical protein
MQGDDSPHPTQLICSDYYFSLSMLLILLDVLPDDVHLSTSSFWDGHA